MSVLFGHPSGNPNSHHAALAHLESGELEAFCVPWMPTPAQLRCLEAVPGLRNWAARLQRRSFSPLLNAPRIEGAWSEWCRMIRRIARPNCVDEGISYEANDWLMRTMSREALRSQVNVIHSYEDCSLWQFETAKKLGKRCVYDMPIGYYPAWEAKQRQLVRTYSKWLPSSGLSAGRHARPEQKRQEMELADLVLAPSQFVLETIQQFFPYKPLALAPYGVDLEFWQPAEAAQHEGPLSFLFAGQISIRKGIPVLLDAWRKAEVKDARLELVGSWNLAIARKSGLPSNIIISDPCSRESLREKYRTADISILPSFFEGFALGALESMACGLPLIATEVMDGMGLINEKTGRRINAGEVDNLVDALRWFSANRDRIPAMKQGARAAVEPFSWERYRYCVREAVEPLL